MAMEVAQHNWKEVVLETTVEAEETVEEALIERRARRTAKDDEKEANKDNLNNSICFDNIGEIENLAANIRTVNGVVNGDETGNANVELLCGLSRPTSYYSPGQDSQSSPSVIKPSENDRIVEEVEEEVVELEFFDTAAVDKLHTHNAYCPNCSSRITKVVLRRVNWERRIVIETDDRGDQTSELVGCLSCFSVFVRIGKKLNPFPLFGSGDTNSMPSRSGTEGGKPVANEGDDWRIPMEDAEASSSKVNPRYTKRPVFPVEVKASKSLEIVKSIVYGGLIESITSLTVVSAAAGSDADTMKIVTIGVANLIGGLLSFVKIYNVRGGSNLSNHVDRYRELLGHRKHFLLHATFALLSYFVFGLVPPVVYGFTFCKSDDRDYKLIAVAAASLLCVVILATAKAYTCGANEFSKYFKTIMSYVITAGTASGVGYAAGHLIKRLMDDLGWFDTKPAPSLFSPEMISQDPAWASY